MYRYGLLLFVYSLLPHDGSAQSPHLWHVFGDFPTLADSAGQNKSLTSGYLQANVWIDPPMRDSVVSEEQTFLFDVHESESFYAPFFFDQPTAAENGWYRYTVLTPYNLFKRTDSVFVRFLPDSTESDPDVPIQQESDIQPARIVNLIILDELGFSHFKILNRQDYQRIDLTLFDMRGQAIYRNKNYLNDFDFSERNPGTYYYRVNLHTGNARLKQSGFVEVIRKAN